MYTIDCPRLSDEFPKIRRIVIAHTFPSSLSLRSHARTSLGPRLVQSPVSQAEAVSQWMMRLVCVSLSSPLSIPLPLFGSSEL